MSYWCSIPNAIRKSKRISAEEKDLLYEIWDRVNEGGYCNVLNEELAKEFNVSIKTISTRLSSLKQKGFINVVLDTHNHKRRIYVRQPGFPPAYSERNGPAESELEDKKRRIQESLKKAIIFGTINFEVLVQKMLESPYLHEVKENNIQFILNQEQLQFLYDIKTFCNKQIDCQLACYPDVNLPLLLSKIKESKFLLTNKNLTLKWLLEHSEEIISDKYKQYYPNQEEYTKNFKGRDYSEEFINSLFQDLDDIDL